MRIIDILVKIANDEEVPTFIYGKHRYKYNKVNKWFDDIDRDDYIKDVFIPSELNDEVVIIDDVVKNKAIEYIVKNVDNTGWLEIGPGDVQELIDLIEKGSDDNE